MGMTLPFVKYHGLGNDFILVDNRHQPDLLLSPPQAIQGCDRHRGIGADGVIFVLAGQGDCDYTMAILNADGSEPEMCGNGIRCFAQFLQELEASPLPATYRIHTLAGPITTQLQGDGQVTVDMGCPRLLAAEIPTTLAAPGERVIDQTLTVGGTPWQVSCVSMGNPHCITFVEDGAALPLAELGPQFEHHPAFPQRTNTEFIEVVRPDYLKMWVWERGAGATLACGTGACAALVAGVLNHRCDRQATVELPGGPLQIAWSEATNHVEMTGPAVRVFSGVWTA